MYKAIIIEDEQVIRRHITDFVNDCIEGFYVIESFMDGQDALNYLETNHVDLIITDIRMLNVSGIDVAKYVYEHELPTKVVILSGYQNFSYAQEAINYNVSSYLTKPIDPEEMEKALNRIKQQLDKENTVHEEQISDQIAENNCLDEKAMIERAISYINQNFDKDISLKMVADYVYISGDYLGKLFKKNTGENFSNYLLSLRMQKAIELLKTGRYTVTEIGEMLGYKNTNYFIKVFKEYTGHTPKKYPRFLGVHDEN